MYQVNDLEMWRERSHELMREAENGRLARRLRTTRPKGAPSSAREGRRISPLRRAVALWGRTGVPFFRA